MAEQTAAGNDRPRGYHPPAWTWGVHAGLIIGAAWLTARGSRLVPWINAGAPLALVVFISIGLVLVLRGNHSRLYRAGFAAAWLGTVGGVSSRWVASGPVFMALAIASIAVCLIGTVMLLVEARRLRRAYER